MKLLIALLLFITMANADARDSSNFHVFGAVGTLFAPASIRVGGKNIEFGLLNQRSFGVTYITSGKYFSEFGIAVMSEMDPALFAGVGTDFLNYGWIYGRAELNGVVSAKNQSHGEILVGVSINF